MSFEKVIIDGAALYFGDCLEIKADIGRVDAVISDPPYGQAYKVNTFYAGGTRKSAVIQRGGSVCHVEGTLYEPIAGDDRPFDPSPWVSFAPTVILWALTNSQIACHLVAGWYGTRCQPGKCVRRATERRHG